MSLADDGIEVHHLRLPPEQLQAYARTKERLWADIHGWRGEGRPRFGRDDARFYARYNALSSDALLAHVPELDVAYVHDFQLLQVGAIAGIAMPCVLRWHVPFVPQRLPDTTRRFLLRMMSAYDGVIVSTRRELEGLSNAGFHGRLRQVYPHTDPADWSKPSPAAVRELDDRLRLGDARVLLCVARMDPVKRQDLAVAAMARVVRKRPDARLLLVGNGSFSTGGLGVSKSHTWRANLEAQVHELGLDHHVTMTGYLPDRLVRAAYRACEAVVLPSDIEGFGLVAYEAWAARKPCILSRGCGAAEVVGHGVTGLLFDAGDIDGLTRAMLRVLDHPDEAVRMGEAGAIALRSHEAEHGADEEATLLEEAVARSAVA